MQTVSSEEAARWFGVLADETRLKIVQILQRHPEGLHATEIAHLVGRPVMSISFHLKKLVMGGLADLTREGRFMRYQLKKAPFVTLTQILKDAETDPRNCSSRGFAEEHF